MPPDSTVDLNRKLDAALADFLISIPAEGEPGRLERILSPGMLVLFSQRIELAIEESSRISCRLEKRSAAERNADGVPLERAEAMAVHHGLARESMCDAYASLLRAAITLLRRHGIDLLSGIEQRHRDRLLTTAFGMVEEARS